MSLKLVAIVFIFFSTHALNSEGFKFSDYPQCINNTRDNSDQPKWQNTMNKMYSTGVCGTWRSFATIITTNTMLSLSGFASSGITSGSFASAIQAYFGNVAAGSIFASLQSIGAIGGVSMFGSATVGTFIAWSVICGDFIDININFMNEDATQCFQNEKILYLSLEQAEEIMNLIKEYEIKNNVQNKVMNIIYDTGKKTTDIFEWISVNTNELNEKYEIKETVKDTTMNAVEYGKQKMNILFDDINDYFGIF